MPYYQWQGVRADAAYCKGVLFARDIESLDRLLFAQDVALISCSEKRYIHLLPISSEQKLLFFQDLQALLAAGIHVWQALNIICNQTSDPRFAQITLQLADNVQQGHALHEGFALHGSLFSPEMIHIAQIGVEADNLPIALHMLCDHLKSSEKFKKQVRGVLMLPICTLMLFLVIMLGVLFVVIPKYAQLFASMSKELPSMTRMLMRISKFVGSFYMLGTLFILITGIVVLLQIIKKPTIKKVFDERMLHVPYLGVLLKQSAIAHFARSLSLLLRGGMPLVPALEIAQEAIGNTYIKEMLSHVSKQVHAGYDLSFAMQRYPDLFSQDIIMLVTVGQETGTLQDTTARACDMYTQKVQRILNRFTFVVQPILMTILGFLVAALICAVYLPLFNLADLS